MQRACVTGLVAGAFVLIGTTNGMSADKTQYSLFNPTPDRLLRDMTTDRPDTTESPFTIDAGHMQIETNLFAYARARPDPDGAVTDSYEFATTNVRIGLTNNAEINFVWQPYGSLRTRQVDPVSTLRDSGIGGFDIRGKVNLWGNDTPDKPGSTALALLPFVTLPTDKSNGISPEYVEGGLIVPLAVSLPNNFGLGLNVGTVFLKDESLSGYHAEYLSTASLAYEWNDKLGTYYEVAAQFGGADGDIIVVATGLTYALTENVQLDAGVNVGVSSAADRINPFVGFSTRF